MEENNENKERTWCMLVHLSALIALLGIPLGNIMGPFIIWLFKKNEFPHVDELGKEAMNFQISMSIYGIAMTILAVGFTPLLIGIFLYPVVGIIVVADIILTIIATVKTSNDEKYRYPFTIRLIQ